MIVWGRRSSSNVIKVLWAAAELGLEVERRAVGGGFGGNDTAEYRAMNPMGLVPVLQDGAITMFESNGIVRYLAARRGEGTFQPRDWPARALAETWMEWQSTTFQPLISAIFWQMVRTAPAARDQKAIEAGIARLPDVLGIADRHLERHAYFAGDALSFGDIVMGVLHWRYWQLDVAKPAMPNIARWFAALQTRQPYRDWVMVPVGDSPEAWSANERALG